MTSSRYSYLEQLSDFRLLMILEISRWYITDWKSIILMASQFNCLKFDISKWLLWVGTVRGRSFKLCTRHRGEVGRSYAATPTLTPTPEPAHFTSLRGIRSAARQQGALWASSSCVVVVSGSKPCYEDDAFYCERKDW